MSAYRFISDLGHGWLEVPIAEVLELNLQTRISPHSYRNHHLAYLEEDCDASLFINARLAKGFPTTYVEVFQNPNPIRNYARFST